MLHVWHSVFTLDDKGSKCLKRVSFHHLCSQGRSENSTRVQVSRAAGQLLWHAPEEDPAEQEAHVWGDRGQAQGSGEFVFLFDPFISPVVSFGTGNSQICHLDLGDNLRRVQYWIYQYWTVRVDLKNVLSIIPRIQYTKTKRRFPEVQKKPAALEAGKQASLDFWCGRQWSSVYCLQLLVLKYVQNKDVFMRYHKAHLTRRLILDISADSEIEENMVEWLRVIQLYLIPTDVKSCVYFVSEVVFLHL